MNDKIYLILSILAIVLYFLLKTPILNSWNTKRKKVNLKKKAKLCMKK